MRIQRHEAGQTKLVPTPLPFPAHPDDQRCRPAVGSGPFALTALPESAEAIFDAIDDMSRRIDDLARELHCLGYFDEDDDDSPRAA